MHPFPHLYEVEASAQATGDIATGSAGLSAIAVNGPAEFGGPGNRWSPETLLCAAVADCFILTFRSLARAARFDWIALTSRVEGRLDRIEKVTRFVAFDTHAELRVPAGANAEQAHALLEQAEARCLVANSLSASRTLHAEITHVNEAGAAV